MGNGATSAVRLDHVTKRYGAVLALDAIQLDIHAGEFVALLGPNGAGKTTAISLMLGLRAPTDGSVQLLGGRPTDRAIRRRCGVMLQDSGLPPMLRVGEVVRLFRAHYPHPRTVEAVLRLADLWTKRDRRVDALSGGERQRLNYAIAIAGDPEVLFLDEPTVGMDVAARHAFYAQLRELSGSGRTIVLTTHYLEEADRLANRVVVIDHGRVIVDGTPGEIKARVPAKKVALAAGRALTVVDFAGLPVEGLALHDHSASFLSNDAVAVVSALIRHDVPLKDLEVTGAALEDAFLALTERKA
ncbi:MAG TPA: ABC transporter ATP-binding protein [Candidatus Limnocylindria bacterium]|nr:ABC transporter ATP-binding protein [Candidatus Limnocylindria bacterium]